MRAVYKLDRIEVEKEQLQESQIDLTRVYEELNKERVFNKSKQELLQKFVKLIGEKSSFAHRVHKKFSSLMK